MLNTPRHLFIPEPQRRHAYEDRPLEIGEGQTISAPHMVAMMAEYLELRPGQKVLEVGSGCGYHAAVIARLIAPGGKLYTLERIYELSMKARENIAASGQADVVEVVHADGGEGYPAHAPYDRIFVTCAAPMLPPPLAEQLADGGRLLIPIGNRWYQNLLAYEKVGGEVRTRDHGGCVFVPLLGAHGFKG